MAEGTSETSPPVYTPRIPERIIKDGNVLLFRYENPNIPNPNPNGVTSHKDLIGRWFVDDPQDLKSYIIMRPPGGDIVIVAIPENKLDDLNVDKHPIAGKMDTEGNNYIVPDELLATSRRINFDVDPSNPSKFLLKDMPKIRKFVEDLVEAEKAIPS